MSLSTEIIDITFEVPDSRGEPVLPILLKGEHLRFIGWSREYTINVTSETLSLEGPFQDDQPNAKEFYQLSQSVAGRWIEMRHGRIRLRIPGRGRWGIDVSRTPNYELQAARLNTWLLGLRGEEAVRNVETELRQIFYYWPGIYAFLQSLCISGAAFLVVFFKQGEPWKFEANLLVGTLFVGIFLLIGILRCRFGLWLGLFANLGLLALPVAETYLTQGVAESYGSALPFFVPFCFCPSAILIPLAMGAYGYALLDHPRQRRLINRFGKR